ncbi:MAG: dTMP kinase [Bauldia sp.]|nr:dTMP kinase [Bauldia sp.]
MNSPGEHRHAASSERGRFVTFEGGEGGGKTTQLLRLARRLGSAGIGVTTTREPGGTPAAEAIRKFLLSGAARGLGPEAETLLFAAARADHLDKLIRPALTQGTWVLCDRFTDSTRAYQGAAGVDPDLIEALERIAVWPTRPDLTLILDLPVEIGLVRAAARAAAADILPDRFERDAVAEHQRRREIFLEIAAAEPDRCIVVDASRPEAEVAEIVWRSVRERLQVAEELHNG